MSQDMLDIVNGLKNAIDQCERLIELTKIVLNEVKAFGRSSRLRVLSKQLWSVLRELESLCNSAYAVSAAKTSNSDPVLEYIYTFTKYVALVSLPYERELLNEIIDLIRKKQRPTDDIMLSDLESLITRINELEESYSKISV